MKYTLLFVAIVATLAFADVEIKGLGKVWFYMYGEENHEPGSTFRAYNSTAVSGNVTENLRAAFSVSYKSWKSGGTVSVGDACLSMKVMPQLSITAGQFKIPLGWAFNRSGGKLFFLERAMVTKVPEFGNYSGKDVGINFHGDFGTVGMDLGYFNGTGIYTDASDLVNKELVGRLTCDPVEWVKLSAGVGMIGQPDVEDSGGVVQEEWSAMGINAYAVADRQLSDDTKLVFETEFWHFGYAGPDIANVHEKAGMDMYADLGVNFRLDGSIFSAVMPALRYEFYSPQEAVAAGSGRAEDNVTVMDFCLNCYVTPGNTIQVGGRNVSYEDDDVDGYTDMYLGWRLSY